MWQSNLLVRFGPWHTVATLELEALSFQHLEKKKQLHGQIWLLVVRNKTENRIQQVRPNE